MNKDTQLPEKIAMNIVHQIGDELFERGIITVKQRQETNDLFIDFAQKLIDQELSTLHHTHEAEMRKLVTHIVSLAEEYHDSPVGAFANRLCGDIELSLTPDQERKAPSDRSRPY